MPAHPLATALAARILPGARILDFGSGAGRNTDTLREIGFDVTSVDDVAAADAASLQELEGTFDAALATHALLHGTPQSVAQRIDALAAVLRKNGLFYAVFASTTDRRYGIGTQITTDTFASADGDEAGVPHVYYDEPRLRAILTPYFEIESLDEREADAIAGRWAHPTTPLRGAVHWLVRASMRSRIGEDAFA